MRAVNTVQVLFHGVSGAPGLRHHLKAIEVREEGALAVNVCVEAQGQLLVDAVPDVHQG